MNMELIQIQLKASCLMNQAAQHQQCGNALGNNGGCCNARNTHMEADDKNQVENHIDDAGGKQKIQGSLGIPCGAQYGGAEVIKHGGGHSHKINTHIQRCLPQDVIGSSHQGQERFGKNDAEENEKGAAQETEQDGGMDRLADRLFVSGAHIVGNQDIDADGEADKYVYQQVDEGACASYGGQSLMAGKPAHNNNIGRVE